VKIGVIGNSHVGALKRAWDKLSLSHPAVELTFFAARGNHMRGLVVGGGKLFARTPELASFMAFTSGGISVIDPNAYDAMLVYALNVTPVLPAKKGFYSRKVLDQALLDATRHSLSFQVLEKIRAATRIFVFVGHDPLPAAASSEETNDMHMYRSGIERLNREIYAPMNAEMLAQPEETICYGRYTRPEFAADSVRLAVGAENDNEAHPADDIAHMNDAFGALWLKHFLARLPHVLPQRTATAS
jgi:hypothetical protein